MKDGDLSLLLPTSTSTSPSSAAKSDPPTSIFGEGRLKFYALAAIILLAFWSVFTGTVSLKSFAGNLTDDLHPHLDLDLDVLEVEERETVVRHMWDVYTHSRRIRLPRFWQEAFEAAYEDLASDDMAVRDAAVSEIAKMSMGMVDLKPPTMRFSSKIGARTLAHFSLHPGAGATCRYNASLPGNAPVLARILLGFIFIGFDKLQQEILIS